MNIEVREGTIEDVLTVDAQIPEFDGRNTKEKLEQRLRDIPHLILIATHNGQPVAYKMGYELSNLEFYSWLGGVVPTARKKGIATQLRLAQESWAHEKGYKAISVKSMNRYPAMLQLLISSGYHISGYDEEGSTDKSKIRFIKHIIDEGA
ncbi:GNAT family N-acetyltransferase [Aliivibrio sp. S4TY2]|uniref:GNAT family N-acetyltransferase n=1 Tax=unclassified Aliivibrio TaxID=2645654 RepID=UPI0023780841|nr:MULTISPECIES: GNAT family N-acetyltransferase [unclassified Aliivibrio]MDD9155663.1 GNAT family N-acetyltransferase [Aliivibrio sp. S4TY2]MDD9160530.1 GNAT family N-acetyltransferase [Aliivibrio sp. S4TY1]MDD9164572.1 GNAT family N-acetyltransferase [Aliivibrio sp. S4MY2]MDD9168378.1 GNAT family N-acetyltransferase [Aliivibrio sp. S4MY4]MDD9184906.1 GNAT family N-acetyltransferase [Aliivibrio sp. S4MY3]